MTGAARGLGQAMAMGLLRSGYNVLLVDHDERGLEDAVQAASGLQGKAVAFVADLAEPSEASRTIEAGLEEFGTVECLVNNAALGAQLLSPDYLKVPPSFDNVSADLLIRFFHVNAIAPILLAQAAVKHMRTQGYGRIVNITTSLDTMLRRGLLPYGGTKASLEAHSAIMAKDLEGTGITVNVLIPGGASNTQMVTETMAPDRNVLIQPEVMVEPLLWLLGESSPPRNGLRVNAALWHRNTSAEKSGFAAAIGWEGFGSAAIMPAA
nr:SDR family oxidoreductase [Propylenella binzhouense]